MPETTSVEIPRELIEAIDVWIAAQPEPRPSRSRTIASWLAEALGKSRDAGSIARENLNASNDE